MAEEEFKTAEDVQKWLAEDRNVLAHVAETVAPTLFQGGYLCPSSLLNIRQKDLESLDISAPHRNILFNKLQQQQQQQQRQNGSPPQETLIERSGLLAMAAETNQEQQQQQAGIERYVDKLLRYFQTITNTKPKTDTRGEEYLDLSACGAINDQNQLEEVYSRRELWDNNGPHPELRGRQVIFYFAKPLLDEVLKAFKTAHNVVLITGTPGIGKSSLRNVHAHFLLSNARKEKARCCLLFAKSGKDTMIRLLLEADGTFHVRLIERSNPWVQLEYQGFTPGEDLFILADVSAGNIAGMSGPGLIMYSSPNKNLANEQIMKQRCVRLGCPLLTKEDLCRYSNDRMNRMFERYGGLARVVWGDDSDENTHKARLKDSLNDVNGFLNLLEHRDYMEGPHRYFYTKLQEDSNGDPLYYLDENPPTVVPAPRFVIKIVAQRIVENMLEPKMEADFGKFHKAVDGILFEEVCLYLIEHHPGNIEFQVRNLSNKKRPLQGHLEGNKLKLNDFKKRKDVDFNQLVHALDGDVTPYLVVPKASNFPGLDAVLALGDSEVRNGVKTPSVAVDLQMTRALDHSISDEGLDIFNQIDSRMASNKGKPATKHIILFLVPEYHYKSFRKQSARNSKRQAELDKFTQFVGCMKVSR